MGDLIGRISEERSGLEKLIGKIPGYKGYKEKEMRREADKLLRETLARHLTAVRVRMDEVQRQLISAGKISFLDEMGSATTKLQTFIDRVRTATYGYAGLFDAVRVKEEQLDALYHFDQQLMEYPDRLNNALDGVKAALGSGQGLAEAIGMVNLLCQEANDVFSRRQDVVVGAA